MAPLLRQAERRAKIRIHWRNQRFHREKIPAFAFQRCLHQAQIPTELGKVRFHVASVRQYSSFLCPDSNGSSWSVRAMLAASC